MTSHYERQPMISHHHRQPMISHNERRRRKPRAVVLMVVIALTALVGTSVPVHAAEEEAPPAGLSLNELCEIVNPPAGGQAYNDPNFTAPHCFDLNTNSYIIEYPTVNEAVSAGTPVLELDGRHNCFDDGGPCWIAFDDGVDLSVGDGYGRLWWWEHQLGGVNGFSVQFRRDRYWVVTGDPIYNENVIGETQAIEIAEQIDARLLAALQPAPTAAPTTAPTAPAAAPTALPGGGSSTEPTPIERPTSEPLVNPTGGDDAEDTDDGGVSTSLIVGGLIVLAAGAWIGFRFRSSAGPAAMPVDQPTTGAAGVPGAAPGQPPPSGPAAPPHQAPAHGGDQPTWWSDT